MAEVTTCNSDQKLEENVAEQDTDEPEVLTVNVEPIVIISDDDENDDNRKQFKKLLLIERKRKWRATLPKSKICDVCSKAFKTNAELNRHKRSHTGEKPFTCTECGNSYSQLSHLQMHIAKHHNSGQSKQKNINCEECGSTFYRKSELDRHMKIHTGDKPFKCEICSKRFTQKNNLVMHVKVHSDDRPHECTECGKRFIARSKMLRHMTKHTIKKKNLGYAKVTGTNYYDDD